MCTSWRGAENTNQGNLQRVPRCVGQFYVQINVKCGSGTSSPLLWGWSWTIWAIMAAAALLLALAIVGTALHDKSS
eukprot:scaffold5745_cov166-Skeletonema_menzelii.AAC.1